jgi:glycogen operon protein
MAGEVATRLCGSSDLYQPSGRLPTHSINFVTCHDGFTLHDLVGYNHKHNRANGEQDRDGANENFSWNCGVEGPTSDPGILGLRRRQARNLFATLMLSQGVPLVLAGDEFLRTQKGNNNAWCQDNETSWLDWTLAKANADFLRFAREMIALRKRHPALRRRHFLRPGEVRWHGTRPNEPDFTAASRTLALTLDGRCTGREADRDFYLAFNAWKEAVRFTVPPAPQGKPWRRAVDTALAPPLDVVGLDEGPLIQEGSGYAMAPHSLLVLIGG